MVTTSTFLGGKVTLHAGDCRESLTAIANASIDSVVTDPPYALVSIGKRFGKAGSAPVAPQEGASGAYARAAAGFMGKSWDTGETAFAVAFWADVFRVLKPGGHVVAFSGTRSYHRLACAIEDAGFEIRDQLAWVYGTGFPKSHDVSKAINKAAGHWRGRAGEVIDHTVGQPSKGTEYVRTDKGEPITAAAAAWEGWGTALKPAWEPIVLARKPLSGTVAETVLAHGTGALNIDGCRVGDDGGSVTIVGHEFNSTLHAFGNGLGAQGGSIDFPEGLGRFPANIVHDGSDEVLSAFPDAPGRQHPLSMAPGPKTSHVFGQMNREGEGSRSKRYTDKGGTNFAMLPGHRRNDAGSLARFFYSAKADADDRLGSKHPTVKPVDLMQWLVRLVTPPGGLVLDPFAGTGTTGEAAFREGMRAVLCEREPDYQADIARRMDLALAGPAMRARATRKKPSVLSPFDMFGETS